MSRRSVRRKNYDHRAFKLAVLVILMGLITYMAYFWVFSHIAESRSCERDKDQIDCK